MPGGGETPQFLKGQMKLLIVLVIITAVLFALGADIQQAFNAASCIKESFGKSGGAQCQVNDWLKAILGGAVLILWGGYIAYIIIKVIEEIL